MTPRRDSAPFDARFGGACAADCGERIHPGETVRYLDDELMHADCATDTEAAIRRNQARAAAVCPSCWTVHAGECL